MRLAKSRVEKLGHGSKKKRNCLTDIFPDMMHDPVHRRASMDVVDWRALWAVTQARIIIMRSVGLKTG